MAHRVSYEHFVGAIPSGLLVRHKCDNPPCVRPDHLEPGTHRDNALDCVSRGRHRRTGLQGEQHPAAKLTETDARAILASSCSPETLAAQYGVTVTSVRNVRRGVTWKSIH
jgi:hypothetical protein